MTSTLPSYKMRGVHLTAVWAFGVSQPIFSLLGNNRELLVLRDVTRLEALLLAAILTFVAPLAAVAYVWIAGKISRWAGDTLYLLVLAGFFIPCALQVIRGTGAGRREAVLLVGVLCAVAVISYARWRAVRLFVGVSALLPLVGLLMFLRLPAVSTAEAAPTSMRASSPAPIVMVVLDELPVASLLTRDGSIDAVRFPNFGRLARDATWYPNATTVHEYTTEAVPAILTGQVPAENEYPALFDHPNNLFSALGGSYDLHVFEASTKLCPETHCPDTHLSLEERLGALASDISFLYMNWIIPESLTGDVLRNEQIRVFRRFHESKRGSLRSFLDSIAYVDSRSLHYVHLLLPHIPWAYLPSGAQYQSTATEGLYPNEVWSDDRWAVQQGLQRHLLQVGYTDKLLGQVLDRLERSGGYDDAMFIVVADHGVAFQPGVGRRRPEELNFSEIANVPLFIKYPRQEQGLVDRRLARTVDVIPTIADVIDAPILWHVEGVSLLGRPNDRTRIVVGRTFGPPVAGSLSALESGTRAAVQRRIRVFGEGSDSLYRFGQHVSLLGTVASRWRNAHSTRIGLYSEELYAHVRTSSSFLPVRISGEVQEGVVPPGTELAIAVNGRISALARCFGEPGEQVFRGIVPEASLKDGFNRVDVFAIEPDGLHPRLFRLGGNADSR